MIADEVSMTERANSPSTSGVFISISAVAVLAGAGVLWARRGSRGEDASSTPMARSNLMSARQSASAALTQLQRDREVPAWAADRITRAEQHLDDVADYLRGRSA